jgi:hypothetical protein
VTGRPGPERSPPTPPLTHARWVWEVVVVDPVTIDVDRKNAVTITWEDGHVSRFPLDVLRANCLLRPVSCAA